MNLDYSLPDIRKEHRGLTMVLTLYSLQDNGTLELFPRNQIDFPSSGNCLGWIYHLDLADLFFRSHCSRFRLSRWYGDNMDCSGRLSNIVLYISPQGCIKYIMELNIVRVILQPRLLFKRHLRLRRHSRFLKLLQGIIDTS